MDILLLVLLILLTIAGVLLSVIQLPGTWLILLSTVGYDWYHGWQQIGWRWLVVLGALATAAEVLEMLASVAAAKKAGASRRAAVGALIGGFAGMLLLSVPIPIIGTILGGLGGCFFGALAGELTLHDDVGRGARIGFFATVGRLFGLVAKMSAAMTMGGVAVCLAILGFRGH